MPIHHSLHLPATEDEFFAGNQTYSDGNISDVGPGCAEGERLLLVMLTLIKQEDAQVCCMMGQQQSHQHLPQPVPTWLPLGLRKVNLLHAYHIVFALMRG